MSTVIIAQGKPGFKMVFGDRRWITPCVVAYGGEKELGSFGVGFFYSRKSGGGGSVWGLILPHLLLQSWRGMKILEGLKVIGPATPCACWTSGQLRMRDNDYKNYVVGDLTKLNGEKMALQARETAFKGAPSQALWRNMLSTCKKHHIDISDFDVKAEVEQGYLKKGSTLKLLMPTSEHYRKRRRGMAERARKREEVLTPPAPEVVGRMELKIEVPVVPPKKPGFFARMFGRAA